MIRLLIVDDEVEVLKNLQKCIDWNVWGIDLVGCASNAIEGRQLAITSRPDIILCDICMPGKDGLTLCEELKLFLPQLKTIMLTGFNETQYLHRALSLGVNDYLLKPAGIDTIVPAVLKAKDEVIRERTKLYEEQTKDALLFENLSVMQLQFINSLLAGEESSEEASQKANMLGIPMQGPLYTTVLIRKFPGHSDESKSEIQLQMEDYRLSQLFESIRKEIHHSYFCEIETNDYFGLLNSEDLEHLDGQLIGITKLFEHCYPEKSEYALAVGSSVSMLTDLAHSYENAKRAMNYSAWDEETNLFFSQEMELDNYHGMDKELSKLEKKIIDALITRQVSLCLELIAHLFNRCRLIRYPISSLKNICKNVFLVVTSSAEINQTNNSYEMKDYHIDEINYGNELEQWINQIILRYFQNRELFTPLPIIAKAVRYIHMNYHKDITLKNLSAELFITPNYLGKLFRQETGCKMSDYLNRFRIDRAKELLRNSDMKTAEIAENVGFRSYKYFLVCFSKYANCSLRDYRITLQNN